MKRFLGILALLPAIGNSTAVQVENHSHYKPSAYVQIIAKHYVAAINTHGHTVTPVRKRPLERTHRGHRPSHIAREPAPDTRHHRKYANNTHGHHDAAESKTHAHS
ncbi:hypothetical protein Lbir_2848 [Legionella birminghamensis]|uniref:Uncharacterized protein n=1 Tax=Legionella birminghamensis TaxID=28083 RepID=A0A378I7M9_9GAMM|nr:hypothetical protein [Legionella birminghamensis]KTC68246.1 hypothetical protein Lbir_2848 [Legionella birminghamensis]STX31043.1 Uncharacterised protein [Legionella birminghamensis]